MIILRRLTLEDLPFLIEVRNEYSTRMNLENNNVFDIENCKKWFLETKPKWFIILNNDEKVGYIRTNGDEVGCDVHIKHRRKGYARLAYQEYLKNKNYATLWVFEDNFAIKLYESLGFKRTGKNKTIRNRKYIHMDYNGI
jgi:hypothetical protein